MASGRGNEVRESYGMIGINLGLVQDWLRAIKISKTDQVHWDMVPWPIRHGGTEPGSGRFREISPWPWLGRYKGVGRVDGELGKATSQLNQLEESWEPQVKWFSSDSWMS
ncbi:hypothetical protein Rs2_46575 [Raphanus sativus]|nr:hypothetical protein Rs2_46575 [Raphanus sativus]